MKTNQLFIAAAIFLCCYSQTNFAQSYVDDSRYLVEFEAFYKSSALEDELNVLMNQDDFIELVILNLETGGVNFKDSDADDGNDDFIMDDDSSEEDSNNVTAKGWKNNALLKEKIKKEIDWYIKYAEHGNEIYIGNKLKESLTAFPKEFEYLPTVLSVLESSGLAAEPTSGFGIGSLLGVSEADILVGISDWALNRAQEELMQAFLREWLEKLQNDPVLAEAFPNTLTMLSTSDLTSIYTNSDTWKATFQQDFDAIPAKVPEIASLILEQYKPDMDPENQAELVAGLEVISHFYIELNKGKRPDEILMLQGERSFLNYKDSAYHPLVHRGVVGTQLFLTLIQSNALGDQISYIKPAAILQLSEAELKALWKLLHIRNSQKIAFVYSSDTTDAKHALLYKDVLEGIGEFKLQLANISETVKSISDIFKTLGNNSKLTLEIEEYHTYGQLAFDLVLSGADILENYTSANVDVDKILLYRQTYETGYEYVMELVTSIKTNEYGTVALNTINLIMWIRTLITKEFVPVTASKYQSLVVEDHINNIQSLIDNIKAQIESLKTKYPNTFAIGSAKVKLLQQRLEAQETLSVDVIKMEIRNTFIFTEVETRTVVKEVATKDLRELESSNEALNTYANLMASVLLAEDSEDIKEALNSVANKKGSYLVRQQSHFSATVSFYPGAKFGWETLETSGLPDTEGTYLGVTLPIGVEAAVGTNWKPIGAVGLFVQVLDLGAVLNYSLQNDNEEVSSSPDINFKQVLSPGAYLTIHFTNNPITLGLGGSYSPELRQINADGVTLSANSFQYGFFLAVDLNVFTLYGSKRKFALQSESFEKAYD